MTRRVGVRLHTRAPPNPITLPPYRPATLRPMASERLSRRQLNRATLARQMLAALADHYAVQPGTLGSGQLLHGTYSKKSPYNTCTPEGVDECTSWGDYFYMEALTRLTKDWEMCW